MNSQNVAAIYPGQGSQKAGMAKDFFDEYEVARKTFEEASDATGEDIKKICFEEDPRLDLTEFTQPCILTAEVAMQRVLEEKYEFKPLYFAGHSLGEYSALVAAGVIPFADAVKIVRKRGALMQEAVPVGMGAMSAVIIPNVEESGVIDVTLNAGAEIANYNSSEQIVISGKKECVDKAGESIQKKYGDKVNVVPLTVSAPFHSTLMQSIEPEFRSYVEQFQSNFHSEDAHKVISNFTSVFHTKEHLVTNLVKQISGSVRWTDNMRNLSSKAGRIYEVGPNRPLGKFFKVTLNMDVVSVINLRSASKAFPS